MIVRIQVEIFFMISILSLQDGSQGLTVTEQTDFIKSVSSYFNRNSIIFLSQDLDELTERMILEKYLNDPVRYYTGVWDFKRLTRGLYSDEVFSPHKTIMVVEPKSVRELISISKRMDMAAFDWLVLPGEDSQVDDIIIPFNCRFVWSREENDSIVLEETYRISRESKVVRRLFGRWNSKTGLYDVKGEFYNNRKDLKGHELKFAVHNLSDGFDPCQKMQSDNGRQTVQCAHFEVWNDLGTVLNYTTNYVLLEDCYTNGTVGISTPMLEMIRTGGADSGNDGYIWSTSRLTHHKFLLPLFDAKVILVTKIPSRKFSFWSYVHPFETNMWLGLIGWLLLSGLIINLIKRIIRRTFSEDQTSIAIDSVGDSFLPFTAICYQGSTSIPKKSAIRFAYLMIYLIPVIFIPSYSGSIISSLSVPSDNIPFTDLKEFEEIGSYKLSAINSTFFHLFLMTDEKFEGIRRRKLVSTNPTPSFEQSFKEICSKKVTFILEWPLLTKSSISCNVYRLDLFLQRMFSSMAVQKNFPYIELFNRQMQKVISSGLNEKIIEKATLKIFKVRVNPFPRHTFQIKPFGFEDVLPLFAVLTGGVCLSVLILLMEIQINRSRNK